MARIISVDILLKGETLSSLTKESTVRKSLRAPLVALTSLTLAAALSCYSLTKSQADPVLTDDQWLANQTAMDNVAAQITDGKDANESSTIQGFSSLDYDVPNKTLNLYWQGTPPQSVRDSIAQASQSGVRVNTLSAQRSLSASLDAQQRLSSNMENASDSNDTSNSIDIRSDGSGLDLVTEEDPSTASGFPDDMSEVAYEHELTDAAGIPVDVKLSDAEFSNTSRQNDSSPFYAGAGLETPNGGYCSSGFAASRGSGSSTTYYLFTAYHCGSGTFMDRSLETIGSAGPLGPPQRSYDVSAIKIKSGASSGGYTYDGPWGSGSFSKAVGGRGSANKGKRFCTSGANSGVHCSIQVYATNSRVHYASGQIVFGLTKASTKASGIAVAQGDSGGPVFGPYAGGWTKVQAVGIISGGSSGTSCPSLASPGATCFKNVFFQPVSTFLTQYSATLRTN